MAPSRNRRRKAGSMRIDAALAAMRPMGFSDSVVRKHVRELLKVYGDGDGDEGWYFIEECSYKLLIDTILDGNGQPEPPSAENLLTYEAGNREGDGASASASGEPGSLLMLCDKRDHDDQSAVKNGCLTEIDDKHRTQETDSQDDTGQTQPGPQLGFASMPFPMIMDRVATSKPCYGWISDNDEDDDNDDNFILLPPANGANRS